MYENAIAYKHTTTLMLTPPPLTVWQFLDGIGLIIAPPELFLKNVAFVQIPVL